MGRETAYESRYDVPAASQDGLRAASPDVLMQRRAQRGQAADVRGESGSATDGALPHFEAIQASFGRHDISDVGSQVGGVEGAALKAGGARAKTQGDQTAFATSPDLHTAAHEAAHAVQQRRGVDLPGGVGREGDRYEQHADAVADRVVAGRSAEDLLSASPRGSRRTAVQHKPDKEVSSETDPLPDVDYAGKVVGTWDKALDATLKAGARSGPGYADREAAIAYAKTLPSGGVVIRHERWYVVQVLDDGSWYGFDRDNIKQMSGSKHPWTNIVKAGSEVPGVTAFVTEDGWAIEATLAPRNAQTADQYHQRTRHLPASQRGHLHFVEDRETEHVDTMSAFKAAGGEGLADLADDEQFMHGFYNAMRDTALRNLDRAEVEAQAKQAQMVGTRLPDADRETIREVAGLLVEKDARIASLKAARRGYYLMLSGGGGAMGGMGGFTSPDVSKVALSGLEETGAELQQRELERSVILSRYPLLSRVDPAEFVEQDEKTQTRSLKDGATEVLSNIEKTRENILDGSLDLWGIAALVNMTAQGLGVADEKRLQLLADKVESTRVSEAILNLALAALQIGLAVGAAFASGGLAVALGVGAIGVGATDAAMATDKYLTRSAAANSSLDPKMAILNPDELGGDGFWVAVAWIGVGVDALAAVKAIRALKAGKAAAEVVSQAGDARLTQQMVEAGAEELGVGGKAASAVEGGQNVAEGFVKVADNVQVPAKFKGKVDLADPNTISFSQKDVKAVTRDGMPLEDMVGSMKKGGYKGDPIEVVEIDGRLVSLDNRRLVSARDAGLEQVPIVKHAADEVMDPEWAANGFKLRANIRQLDDGTLVVGGKAGEIVYRKGQIATTYGEAVLYRSANQGNIKAGIGAGTRFPLGGRLEAPHIKTPKPTGE